MLNAPTDPHRSRQLIQESERLMERVVQRIAQSNRLIAWGSARKVARTHASVTHEETNHSSTP